MGPKAGPECPVGTPRTSHTMVLPSERIGRFGRFRPLMSTRPAPKDPDWVTLTEACRLLGVSPSTIRRWGDTGMVRTFVTPGGHRRFSRAGLEALLPERPTSRPSLIDLGETPGRMARGYRRAAEAGSAHIPWV